jgi:hypothetical protein
VPDPIVAPDAQPAAPSAAVPSIDPSADPLESLSGAELQTWRQTGAMPEPKPATPKADSSPAPAVETSPASTDASPVAASEPADYKAKTKARIDELLAKSAREEERANRAEQRARELEARQRQPHADATPAASSPAPAGLVKPDPESFAYGTADPAYLEALTDYKVAVADQTRRTEWEERQRQNAAREESTRVIQAFEGRAAEARTKHADFDAVALLAPTEIPQGSAADLWVMEDEAGAEILYHLQQPANAAERRRILSLSPREQLKELVRLGDRLTSPAPAARSTQAPPPPATLSTRPTPADPVERALALGDSDEGNAAYIRAQNARDLARLKGK